MKRILAVLLCAALLASLCACSDDTASKRRNKSKSNKSDASSEESNTNTENWFHMPSDSSMQDGSMPSKSLMQTDILDALSVENAYASITSAEVVKSLTNDDTYSMTLDITAETTYADWQYQAEMFYTKYDQGWMLDEVNWLSEEYVLARTPDVDTILALVNEEEALSEIVPMDTGVLDYDDIFESETLLFSWENRVQLKHAHYWAAYTTRWVYNAASDTWCFTDYDDDSAYLAERYDFNNENLDFSGSWGVDNAPIYDFIITGFSQSGFTLDCSLMDEGPTYFVPIGRPSFASNDLTHRWFFSEETGLYVVMQYYGDKTAISVCDVTYGVGSSISFLAGSTITTDLPSLND